MSDAKQTGGFRGTRNEDTTAAVAARKRIALRRKIAAAEALLTEHGYTVTPPATQS
jgi:hypothetical protein